MRRLLLLPLLLAAACAPAPGTTGGPSPAASRTGPDYGDLDPNKATPQPPGLSGTPDPFAASHPATSLLTFPEDGSQPPIQASYVVGQVQAVDGRTRVSCLAQGKDARGTTMQFSFEAFAAAPPTGPTTWGVKKDATLAAGEARVTHFRGAGTGWVAPRGSVQLTKVEPGAGVVRWDFLVECPMQPAGTDSQGRATPTPGPRASATASPMDGKTAPTAAPSAQTPYQLTQVDTEFFVRWSGTFYTAPAP